MNPFAKRVVFAAAMMILTAVSFLTFVPAAGAVGNVVFSQVYGGGGGATSTYKCDYVELFNRSGAAVDISGWSIQYAAATGTSWAKVTIPAATVLPGGAYYVVQLQCGTTGLDLPVGCASLSSTTIAMAATAGKIALLNNNTTLTGSGCPFPAGMVDFVGYGAADCSETSPTLATSATTAARRLGAGFQDLDNNLTDFVIASPVPCTLPTPVSPSTWGQMKLLYR